MLISQHNLLFFAFALNCVTTTVNKPGNVEWSKKRKKASANASRHAEFMKKVPPVSSFFRANNELLPSQVSSDFGVCSEVTSKSAVAVAPGMLKCC
jgi:hypothetical protein